MTSAVSRATAALVVRFAGRAPAGFVARAFQSGMVMASRVLARVGARSRERGGGAPDELRQRLVRGVEEVEGKEGREAEAGRRGPVRGAGRRRQGSEEEQREQERGSGGAVGGHGRGSGGVKRQRARSLPSCSQPSPTMRRTM